VEDKEKEYIFFGISKEKKQHIAIVDDFAASPNRRYQL
jgi:hypothetical protein